MWVKGDHVLKFGADIRSLTAITPLGFNGSDNFGTFGYSNAGNAMGQYMGVDFADFLIGVPNNTLYDFVQQDNNGQSKHYHFLPQDQWRATPQLTINDGVRYQFHPGYHDPSGDIGNFDPSIPLSGRAIYPNGKQSLLAKSYRAGADACDADGVNNTNSATINGAPCMPVQGNSAARFPSYLKTLPHLRFMPRFGIAYRLFHNDNKVIRGGYGIYNITVQASIFLLAHWNAAGASYRVHQYVRPHYSRDRAPVA